MKQWLPLALWVLLLSCSTEKAADPTPTTAASGLTWNGDIASIISNRCGTSACHASGSVNQVYVGSESLVKARKADVISRIDSTSNPMPPTTASATQRAITADERTKIKTFLNQ